MNKFVKSGSRFFLFVTCFFIVTLFVDQANLLDVVIGDNNNVDIQHPEEVEASFVQSTPLLDNISFEKVVSSNKGSINNVKGYSSISKKVIVDEDSPSTASINVDAIILSNSFQSEHQDFYKFISIQYGIYLQNRTLLI
jgi:hypothetical protein